MTDDKSNFMRNAIITSNNGIPILQALEESLPSEYKVKGIVPEKKAGNYDIIIQTPTDEICIIVKEDGLSAKTSNVMIQDQLPVQPNLPNDELSKLAVALNKTKEVSMQVMASHNDLLGK